MTPLQIARNTQFIKATAARLGFEFCGIAKAEQLDEDARRLEQWLLSGYNGKLGYMEHYFDLRIDPRKLVPGAKSVISLMMNYFPKESQQEGAPKIAKFAYGEDYHLIIRDKLNEFLTLIRDEIGAINGRGFVDSAPVLEKTWAQKSGLGWVGKNHLLITKQSGSFFFICNLIVDLELNYDPVFAKDFCGSCTRCVDACPTDALHLDGRFEANKCISYLTIELKDDIIPEEYHRQMEGWSFGCDICQDVCPWNRFSKPIENKGLQPLPEILNLTTAQWEEMSEDVFNQLLKRSPLQRTKWKGMQRNLKYVYGSGSEK